MTMILMMMTLIEGDGEFREAWDDNNDIPDDNDDYEDYDDGEGD